MKKLLGASLSVALVYGTVAPAQAELLKNLQMTGEIETHAVRTNNLSDAGIAAPVGDDADGRAHTRVIVNAGFDLNEDAAAVVTVTKGAAGKTYGSGSQTATAVQADLTVSQAYVHLKNVLNMDHKLGTQFYGMPGDLVVYFGPSRAPTIRTLPVGFIDAWTGWFKFGENDHYTGNVIIGKFTDSVAPETDTDVRGVEIACSKMADMKVEARLYDRYLRAGGSKGHLYTLSPRVSGKLMDGNVGYKGELALNTGNNPGGNCTGDCKASGTAFLLGADYSMPFMGKLKISGEFGLGSGDDAGGDSKEKAIVLPFSDYRPGDIWGGNSGVLLANAGGITTTGLANTTTFNIGAWHDTEKWPKLGWGLHYYDFSATKKAASPTGKKHVASEIDLRAKWTHSDKISISAGSGRLMVDASGADPISQHYVNFHLAF